MTPFVYGGSEDVSVSAYDETIIQLLLSTVNLTKMKFKMIRITLD